MTTTDAHWRCTHRARQRDGSEVECSDQGTYALDRAAKTWRPAEPSDRSRRCFAHGPGADTKPHGHRRRVTKPNARLQRVAGLLLGTSVDVTKALQAVDDELSQLGFPGSSSKGASYTTTDLDPVGGDAVRIHELTEWREALRDAIRSQERGADGLLRLVRRILNVNHAHGVKLCAENQQGREGSIEWGDPTCTELDTKAGLCSACYQAERKWRIAHDRPTVGVSAA